jgi:putative transposase
MVWRESGIMDERLKFVAAYVAEEDTMAGLCEAYGISRKTGYKWLGRYKAHGPAGLADLPRAPLRHGRATPFAIVKPLLAEKEAHPAWGPKKLIARLKRKDPELAWPAASTAGEILKRHGLVKASRRRIRACGNGPWPAPEGPNAVWTADHKGWFRTRDGRRCEPLTVMDAASRYALAIEALSSTAEAQAWPVFERLFFEFGLPSAIRSDNGPPFAGTGLTGLSVLAARFIKLGIALQRIKPGKPQQNGQHERFHGTLVPLQAKPAASLRAQQKAFDRFRKEYNEERPHEALGQTPPAEHYTVSLRPMPATMPEPDYPKEAAVRQVRSNGEIKWQGQLIHICSALAGEPVAIEESQEGGWMVRFYHHSLGVIDAQHAKLRRPDVPLKGHIRPSQTSPEL